MLDNVIIRKANESDLQAIMSLIVDTGADNGKKMELHDANVVYQSMLNDSNYFQIIATTEQEIVGIITLVIVMQMTHEGETIAFISDLIISNNANNRDEQLGIAHELLKYTTNLAQEYGCHKTIMQSNHQQNLSELAGSQLGFKQNIHSFEL